MKIFSAFLIAVSLSPFMYLSCKGDDGPTLQNVNSGKLQVQKKVDVANVPTLFSVGFALFTKGNEQYVAYYDTAHVMTLAKRTLPNGVWDFQKLNSKVGYDSHNYITMYVDSYDFIHVSGNMHASNLVYFKSSKPGDIHSMQSHGMVGNQETKVTYPLFLIGPSGEILYHYRFGSSGDGYEVYNVLNEKTQTWKRFLDKPLIDGGGQTNAYMSGPDLGPDGYYHMIWVWRETPDCSTNHTLSYAKSKDLKTWEGVDGRKVSIPITMKDSMFIVDPTPVKGGLLNGGSRLGFDSEKRPMIGYYKYDAKGNTQLYFTRFENGKWHCEQLTSWNFRWDFQGGGSLGSTEVSVGTPEMEGSEIMFPYSQKNEGHMKMYINEETLKPIRKEKYVDNLDALRKVTSNFSGMQTRLSSDLNPKTNNNTVYMLRWETLPANRDTMRTGVNPPPFKLQVVELERVK